MILLYCFTALYTVTGSFHPRCSVLLGGSSAQPCQLFLQDMHGLFDISMPLKSVCTCRDWRGKLGNNHMFSICLTMSNINFTWILLYQLTNTESCEADFPQSPKWETLLLTHPLTFPRSNSRILDSK